MKNVNYCKYITEIDVRDPDTNNQVSITIYKDPESEAVFGIDTTYIEQVDNEIVSPFNNNSLLILP